MPPFPAILLSVFIIYLCENAAPQMVTKQILAARKRRESVDVCVAKTITKPGSRLICFCHSSVQKKSALILSYNNNITNCVAHFSLERRNVYKIGPAAGPGGSNNEHIIMIWGAVKMYSFLASV